jgi:hypothetical protein
MAACSFSFRWRGTGQVIAGAMKTRQRGIPNGELALIGAATFSGDWAKGLHLHLSKVCSYHLVPNLGTSGHLAGIEGFAFIGLFTVKVFQDTCDLGIFV